MPDKKDKPDIKALEARKDINGLLSALSYDDFEVQSAAVTALHGLGDSAITTLIRELKTKNQHVKIGIIESLGKLKDPRALQPLIDTLSDENPEIRWGTAIALAGIGDERAFPALRKALEDKDKYVRYGAASALSKMGWVPSNDHEKALYFIGLQEWWVLKQLGKEAIPALAIALKDRDAGVRGKVIESLGEIHDSGTTPLLVSSLGDESSDVRWKAVMASTKSGVSR